MKTVAKIWRIIQKHFKRKKLDSELEFNGQHLKIKIKSYNNTVTINFRNVHNDNNVIPKETVACICLSVIVFDSVFSSGKHYYFPFCIQFSESIGDWNSKVVSRSY